MDEDRAEHESSQMPDFNKLGDRKMYTKKLQKAHQEYLRVVKLIAKAHCKRIVDRKESDISALITEMHKHCAIIREEVGSYPCYDSDIHREMDIFFAGR